LREYEREKDRSYGFEQRALGALTVKESSWSLE
jgi:hypothetical protein